MSISITDIWDRLSLDGEVSTGYVRLRIPTLLCCAVYAAKSIQDGSEALIAEVATESLPGNVEFPRSAGFQISASVLQPGRGGRTRLYLSLTSERYADVFRTLCADLVSRMESAPDEPGAVRLLLTQLGRWQAFLRVAGTEGLSLEVRRGLAGEISFLRDELVPRLGDAAVVAWTGWDGADHDFQLPHASIEVKATAANTPHGFHISNVGQLDDSSTPALFVCLLILDETQNAGESLPDLIASVRAGLSDAAAGVFEDRLAEMGVVTGDLARYATPKYTIRRRMLFRVAPGFPRLLAAELPSGVENVRYTVAVAACAPFEIDHDVTLASIITTGEHVQ